MPYYSGAVNCGIPKHSQKLARIVFQNRFGMKRGRKKKNQLLLKVESCHFFYWYYYKGCVPCISSQSQRNPRSHVERRRAVLPRAGGCAESSRQREAIIADKNKKIEL